MNRWRWLVVVALLGILAVGPTNLILAVRNLGKERMPSMEDAEMVAVFPNGCGDGRIGAIMFKVGEDGAQWVGFYFDDDPDRPFAVVNRTTSTVYMDLDRDGRVDEVKPATGGPCDDASRVTRKKDKAGPVYPLRPSRPSTVTM